MPSFGLIVSALAVVVGADASRPAPTKQMPAFSQLGGAKLSKLDSSKVLALRGGGMVDQATWLKAFTVFMGLYGTGFVLAPSVVIEQNFDTPYDKYHIFISRLSGIFMLTLLYTWSKMDIAAAFPIAVATCVATAILGPLYAELNLETKPAHKAAFLMAPFVVTGLMSL